EHLKQVGAPKHWMLGKLTGMFAPHPSTGPHRLKECLPRSLPQGRGSTLTTLERISNSFVVPSTDLLFITLHPRRSSTSCIKRETDCGDAHTICYPDPLTKRHLGSFDVVHGEDANENSFAAHLSTICVIGKGNWTSLPQGKGIALAIANERDKRWAVKQCS
ncbi:40S ribosomal protein S4, X isoform, partial [Galemys pyrenaicus]